MITRRGTSVLKKSDNAKTFVSTARWTRQLQKDSQINEYLSEMNIKWKFSLVRSLWGGEVSLKEWWVWQKDHYTKQLEGFV